MEFLILSFLIKQIFLIFCSFYNKKVIKVFLVAFDNFASCILRKDFFRFYFEGGGWERGMFLGKSGGEFIELPGFFVRGLGNKFLIFDSHFFDFPRPILRA
jgi:hypothetical protein